MMRGRPKSTLFPYTTLFRSRTSHQRYNWTRSAEMGNCSASEGPGRSLLFMSAPSEIVPPVTESLSDSRSSLSCFRMNSSCVSVLPCDLVLPMDIGPRAYECSALVRCRPHAAPLALNFQRLFYQCPSSGQGTSQRNVPSPARMGILIRRDVFRYSRPED